MRPFKSILRDVLLLCSPVFVLCVSGASAQEKQSTSDRAAVASAKNPAAAKRQAAAVAQAEAEEQSAAGISGGPQDEGEQIRKRDEWFYKQRSSVNGHIPAGARLKAFQHMQRMMAAEGKLVQRPDGSYAAAVPQAGTSVGGPWKSIGPTPTSGGFYSPVSGRIEAIAVDPSDTSGNTVLIGGAQGGIWRSTDGGTTWTPTGDSNPSLAMGSIAFAPSNSSIVYAGTGEQASTGFDTYYGAGVLKSTDHGQTWTQTCTTPSATCPFIGPFNNTLNFGFFNDGGARISYVAVNPSNPNLVLVGAQIVSVGVSETAGGIYCSSDGGVNWMPLLSGEAGSFVGFATSTIAYAALGRPLGTLTGAANPNGVYKSTNANATSCSGITFSPVAQQPTTQSMGRIDLGIAPSDTNGNTVYASIANGIGGSHTNLGVFVTTNGGTSWTQTTAPDICRLQCWYDNVIKVDPNNKDVAFLGGSSATSSTAFEWVMRSTNGTTGGPFSPAIPTPSVSGDPALPHVDEHALAFFKATSGTFAGKVRLYLGNDGGLWRTDDAEAPTVTWMNLNQNLTLTQFYPNVSVNPSNQGIAYGGAQDNSSQVMSQGVNWTATKCGDGGQTAVDFQVPTSVYITCQVIALFFSPTGGTDPASYTLVGNGIDPNGTDAVDFIPPIATDPATPGRVYFGTDHLYQSSDNGNTFTAISGVLPSRIGNYLTTIGVSPNKPDVVYAGANGGGVFFTNNATSASPSFVEVGVNQLPLRNVTAVVVDGADATGSTAYAVFSGFAVGSVGDHFGHIFKTINAGATWTDVSCTNLTHCESPNASDLPNIPVNDLVIDPEDPAHNTLYAATDIGCFVTQDGGLHWNTLGTGFPNVAVLSLKLHDPSRTLVAGTHGRGAWSLSPLPFVPTFTGPHVSSLSPISAQAPATSPLTLTVNGSGLTGATAVQWKAGSSTTSLTPTVISDNQVTAIVPTSLLAAGGTAQVSVSVVTATSNPLTFSILSGPPTISSVSPSGANVNTNGQVVTVTGTNFSANSQVMLNPDFDPGSGQTNGKLLIPTTFTDSQHLSATIPASFLANFGSTNSVGVHTPPPGGGTTFSPPPIGTGATPLPTFTVTAPAPANDNFAKALSITTNSFTDTKDSSGATTEAGDPTPSCAPGSTTSGRSNSIWYQFKPATTGMASLNTQGSNFDTVLSIWTGSAGSLTAVACDNGIVDPGIVTITQLSNVCLAGGTTYFIMLSSFGPPDPNPVALGGMSVLNFTFTPTPDFSITSTGTTQTVNAGQTATFTNAITVGAQNGFSAQVNLSCSLPITATATTCSVNPNTFATGSGTATVTVGTMARSLMPPSVPMGRFFLRPQFVPLLLLTLLLAILLLRFARTRRQRFAGALPFAVLVVFLLLQAMGCGGGPSTPPPPTGTPAGTYTVTVTGTSGNTTHTASLTLMVN